MKLWDKGQIVNKEVEKFTVGNDYLIDLNLVPYDCMASIAHATMLQENGILTSEELKKLKDGLQEIMVLHAKGEFTIRQEDEDCHTAIENFLTTKYGDVGKKIHTARSRNDQVLTALRLYEKAEVSAIKELLQEYHKKLHEFGQKYSSISMPGYTHMQKAMPMPVTMWLGSFSDAVTDDLKLLERVHEIIDQSPLGTAAGFGVPILEIDREATARSMGFARVMQNPIYTQMSRGKFEATILHTVGQIMLSLNKLANDLILLSMVEFSYVVVPQEFCTGSSIMPQKKNPDILELIRAQYHVVLGEEYKVKSLIANLMSGYNRDLQLTKEPVIKSITITKDCLKMMCLLLDKLKINAEKCKAAMTSELYATEEAYKLVKQGMPFREAYQQIGRKYAEQTKK